MEALIFILDRQRRKVWSQIGFPTEGKRPAVIFRLYGPDEPFWNETFKMPDVELVS